MNKSIAIFESFAVVTVIAIFVLSPVNLKAQENPITWSLKLQKPAKPFKPGDRFTVQVIAQIKEGWHLYSMNQSPTGPESTTITLPTGQPFKLSGRIKAPVPQTAFDEFFQIHTSYYDGSVTFTAPLSISSRARTGRHKLKIVVSFQSCSTRLCLPLKTFPLESMIVISAGNPKLKARK